MIEPLLQFLQRAGQRAVREALKITFCAQTYLKALTLA
jgi:hypothetical protein